MMVLVEFYGEGADYDEAPDIMEEMTSDELNALPSSDTLGKAWQQSSQGNGAYHFTDLDAFN